jgi:hypothetical protein
LRIVLIVEGETEKAFLSTLRLFLKTRLAGVMPKIVPDQRAVTRHLIEGADAVIALTDVYTGTREFADAADAKSKMREWVGPENRFYPHAAQHDFEAWLLPYWDDIRRLSGSNRNPPSGSPELLNHMSPPAHPDRGDFSHRHEEDLLQQAFTCGENPWMART